MIQVPNTLAALVDKGLRCIDPWFTFFRQFSIAPSPMLDIDVTTSPFAYQAVEPGNIHISGGTVSAITLTRGVDTITITGTNLVPVCIGDIVETTYSVLPTIKFLPNYATRRNG